MSLPLDADVIDWWQKQSKNDKDLSLLALTVLQLPCTQVTVERNFNGLGQILTRFRAKISSKSLEQLLFVKANKDLLKSMYLDYNV